jgi:Secretion system C-terminal sorting domain/PA domain
MKKILTIALSLFTIISHAQQADTTTLAVLNTGRNFIVTAADFGVAPTEDLIGEMVMAFDTVMVLKADSKSDSSGKKMITHQLERRSNKMSSNLKDKIALIDFNKDYDVTQMCINIQRAGAKALIIIHDSNDKKLYKLLKKGIFKDSIKIPCYTVPFNRKDNISELLPTVVGIKMPVAPTQALVSNNARLGIEAKAELAKSRIEWISNTGDKNDYFIIEKYNFATDKFEKMSVINSNHIAGVEEHVSYDTKPSEGENHYRIQQIQLDGSVLMSEIRTVEFSSLLNGITIFPNPVEDEINISMKDYLGKTVDIALFDMQGKKIISQHIEVLQTPTITLPLNEKALMGQYMMHIKAKGNREVVKMLTVGK